MKFVGKFFVKEMERYNKGGFVVKGVTGFQKAKPANGRRLKALPLPHFALFWSCPTAPMRRKRLVPTVDFCATPS
jgi:hypothetical protein